MVACCRLECGLRPKLKLVCQPFEFKQIGLRRNRTNIWRGDSSMVSTAIIFQSMLLRIQRFAFET